MQIGILNIFLKGAIVHNLTSCMGKRDTLKTETERKGTGMAHSKNEHSFGKGLKLCTIVFINCNSWTCHNIIEIYGS